MDTARMTAAIAATASIAAAVVSWFGAFQARRTADRDHAWSRLVWALARRRDSPEYDISKRVLVALEDVAWWSEPDRRLATQALRRIVAAEAQPDDTMTTTDGRTGSDAAPETTP
ncbi:MULTISPECIES: hypothetical protein [Curtobacterium]|uniref:hypothetical protein n=1 Tax=Curtobacterium TaxID=2034 RepID=UPI001386903E|nr:hypothetical protein [Curtobacterium sp. HSID17257]